VLLVLHLIQIVTIAQQLILVLVVKIITIFIKIDVTQNAKVSQPIVFKFFYNFVLFCKKNF